MRIVFLDTETTGLSPEQGDRLIEVGCVEMLGRKLTGRHLHHFVNPGRDVPDEAVRIHGITSAFLQDKPPFAEVAQDLIAHVRGAELVIHNAPFDLGFLDMELARLGLPPLRSVVAGVTDSLVMAKALYPGKRNSLDALCERLEVDHSGRTLHGALLDAELLADVYLRMTRGQHSLLADEAHAGQGSGTAAAPAVDLRGLASLVVRANPQECAAHAAYLDALEAESKGKTTAMWRRYEALAAEVHG